MAPPLIDIVKVPAARANGSLHRKIILFRELPCPDADGQSECEPLRASGVLWQGPRLMTDIQPLKPDGRQSETALLVQRGVCRLLHAHGFAPLAEFTLASGRRADLCAINSDGLIWIVEIKSSLEDFRADQKWPEYRDYCDRFCFAIPLTMDQSIIPEEAGLIVADSYGAEVLRMTGDHPLHASRRKAVTLSFARAAALRSVGVVE
jgi:hypothetical protein